MTSHYVDLALRGDEETALREVLDIAFGRLHRALAALAPSGVGVSFPAASRPGAFSAVHTLGNVIRLHGDPPALAGLLATPWSTNLADHLTISLVRPVPEGAEPIRLVRVQPKSNTERLLRRAMKRHHLTLETARERYAEHRPERVALPYLSVRSASTNQSFRLYVNQRPAAAPCVGTFSAYGLSSHDGPTVWSF